MKRIILMTWHSFWCECLGLKDEKWLVISG